MIKAKTFRLNATKLLYMGGWQELPPDVAEAIARRDPPGEVYTIERRPGRVMACVCWMGGLGVVPFDVADEIEARAAARLEAAS